MTIDSFLVSKVSGTSLDASSSPAIRATKKPTAFQQFEALLLQNVIETILPRGAESLYGRGFAGDSWRSMLAEKLALEIARNGSLGIAGRLEAGAAQHHRDDQIEGRGPATSHPVQVGNREREGESDGARRASV